MNQPSIPTVLLGLTMMVLVGMTSTAAVAESGPHTPADEPSVNAMTVDALVVRPIGLVTTVAGVGLFLVSWPFTLLSGNSEAAAENLIKEPAAFTFTRPLGEFDDH